MEHFSYKGGCGEHGRCTLIMYLKSCLRLQTNGFGLLVFHTHTMPMYTTPTSITEALCLITYVQLC